MYLYKSPANDTERNWSKLKDGFIESAMPKISSFGESQVSGCGRFQIVRVWEMLPTHYS